MRVSISEVLERVVTANRKLFYRTTICVPALPRPGPPLRQRLENSSRSRGMRMG
jgi:hypothetical protein